MSVPEATWKRAGFLTCAALTLTPWASPGLALAAGVVFALVVGNPWPKPSARLAKQLLQVSVVGLGFGMSLGAVWQAGAEGVGYTGLGIAVALALGLLLGRVLRVGQQVSVLISAGTSICGGSAIAAIGPAIGASAEGMTVSLATVFLLNAVALYVFPWIGHAVHLSDAQFGVWAAVAIHDTSSVVGAASTYGAEALERATVLKMARALWILPLTLAAGAWAARRGVAGAAPRGAPIPWFIGLFLLAAGARSALPDAAPAFSAVARLAKVGLVLTLFLIGAGLTRSTLAAVGLRPLAQGVALWLLVGGLALFAVWRWVPA